MSVLRKVEEAYLGVLRLVIILVATLMLLASIVFLALAGGNWKEVKPAVGDTSVIVKPEEITQQVLAHRTEKAPLAAPDAQAPAKSLAEDTPNKAELDRAAAAIVTFFKRAGGEFQSVSHDRVVSVLKNKAEPYSKTDDAKPFAIGLALAMEKTLADPAVVKLIEPQAAVAPVAPAVAASVAEGEPEEPAPEPAPRSATRKVSPVDVVNDALSTYEAAFEKRVKDRSQAQIDAAAEEARNKATAMTQLYMAGAVFGSFLLLVFISLLVKIERNLRALTVAPVVVRAPERVEVVKD